MQAIDRSVQCCYSKLNPSQHSLIVARNTWNMSQQLAVDDWHETLRQMFDWTDTILDV